MQSLVKVIDLTDQKISLEKVKKIVDGALEICDYDCKQCPGNTIESIGNEYRRRKNTCAVGYFVSEKVGNYINRHDPKNFELIRANTHLNIVALNYPQEMTSALEELKRQL